MFIKTLHIWSNRKINSNQQLVILKFFNCQILFFFIFFFNVLKVTIIYIKNHFKFVTSFRIRTVNIIKRLKYFGILHDFNFNFMLYNLLVQTYILLINLSINLLFSFILFFLNFRLYFALIFWPIHVH